MAKALSFLLRNALFPQLKEGVNKILHEAARKPYEDKISRASALLLHVMRGSTSTFHSRALSQVLDLLTDSDFISISDKFKIGSDTFTEIVIATLERCMELNVSELNLIQKCLYKVIANSLSCGYSQHLSRLLSVLISTISIDHGRKVGEYQKIQKLIVMLMQKFNLPYSSGDANGLVSEVADKTFQLTLCVINGIYNTNNTTGIPKLSLRLAHVFQLKSSRYFASYLILFATVIDV